MAALFASDGRMRAGLPGCSSYGLDGESQLFEDLDRAALAALEITGAKTLARGELISCAQDRFRRVAASVPDQLICRGTGETMLGEEPLRPQSVVLLDRAQDVTAGHLAPRGRMCHRFLLASLWCALLTPP